MPSLQSLQSLHVKIGTLFIFSWFLVHSKTMYAMEDLILTNTNFDTTFNNHLTHSIDRSKDTHPMDETNLFRTTQSSFTALSHSRVLIKENSSFPDSADVPSQNSNSPTPNLDPASSASDPGSEENQDEDLPDPNFDEASSSIKDSNPNNSTNDLTSFPEAIPIATTKINDTATTKTNDTATTKTNDTATTTTRPTTLPPNTTKPSTDIITESETHSPFQGEEKVANGNLTPHDNPSHFQALYFVLAFFCIFFIWRYRNRTRLRDSKESKGRGYERVFSGDNNEDWEDWESGNQRSTELDHDVEDAALHSVHEGSPNNKRIGSHPLSPNRASEGASKSRQPDLFAEMGMIPAYAVNSAKLNEITIHGPSPTQKEKSEKSTPFALGVDDDDEEGDGTNSWKEGSNTVWDADEDWEATLEEKGK